MYCSPRRPYKACVRKPWHVAAHRRNAEANGSGRSCPTQNAYSADKALVGLFTHFLNSSGPPRAAAKAARRGLHPTWKCRCAVTFWLWATWGLSAVARRTDQVVMSVFQQRRPWMPWTLADVAFDDRGRDKHLSPSQLCRRGELPPPAPETAKPAPLAIEKPSRTTHLPWLQRLRRQLRQPTWTSNRKQECCLRPARLLQVNDHRLATTEQAAALSRTDVNFSCMLNQGATLACTSGPAHGLLP